MVNSRSMSTAVLVFTFISGLTAAVAVLHGLLYLFLPKSKANVYYALFTGLMSMFYFGVARAQQAGESASQHRWDLFFVTVGVPMMFAGLRFELAAFTQKVPAHIKAMAVGGAAIVIGIWTLGPDFPSIWVNVLGIAVSIEMFRIVGVAMYRRHPDAWVIGIGFGIMTLVGVYEILVNVGILPWWTPLALPTGVVALTLSMSAYLSRDVARTHKHLEEQLAEVRRLDALTLAQQEEAHAAELKRRLLEEDNRRHVAQLEEARKLQLSMLPAANPDSPTADVAFKMWTAEQVGGDYYDYRQSASGALTIALGDATGHGLDSGLMVAATKSLFQSENGQSENGQSGDGQSGDGQESLAATLGRISRGLKSMRLRRMNVAMQLVTLRPGSIRVASAGMPPALLWRAATGEIEEILIPGPPLGAMARFEYQEAELPWEPGDTLLMMTDGLPETLNASGDDLGYDAVRRIFRQAAGGGPESVLEALFKAALEFADGHPQEDDLTLAVARAK